MSLTKLVHLALRALFQLEHTYGVVSQNQTRRFVTFEYIALNHLSSIQSAQ